MSFVIRCDVCGKFISAEDLEDGLATHKLVEPDNEFGAEVWETLCEKHVEGKSEIP